MIRNELLLLLNSMTLEEKVSQLIQLSGAFFHNDGVVTGPSRYLGIDPKTVLNVGSVLNMVGASTLIKTQKDYLEKSNKKIPLLFMADVINGFKTIFPVPLGLSCSFNPNLINECAKVSVRESSAAGLHVTFSPMVDLVRDPRWGRVMESTGEDSFLNSIYAKAMVEGYQGESLLEEDTIVACVKHFAAYGAASSGKDYDSVDISERTLREDYLKGYKSALMAGSPMIMTAFNTINGIPATANKHLLKTILREEWDFKGIVISDYNAVFELVNHGYASCEEDACRLSIEASVDIDMMSSVYAKHMEEIIRKGIIKEELVDEAVLRVLELKNELGLFENPYRFADPKKEEKYFLSSTHREVSRRAACESIVLLKNEENILPLKKEQKIAYIGPYVDSKSLYGSWVMFGDTNDCVTIKEGVLSRMDVSNVSFEQGCLLLDENPWFKDVTTWSEEEITTHKERAIELAKNSEVVVLTLGEHYRHSGEGASKSDITLPKVQIDLLKEISKVNDNIVVVIFNGRPLDLTSLYGMVKGIIIAWFPGSEGGNSITDVLYGDYNPSGRLTMSFPYSVGQVPVYYNHFNTGRPARKEFVNSYSSRYLEIPNCAFYPFGYGLSYSDFIYSKVSLSTHKLYKDGTIKASVRVKNNSSREGKETVQLYIRDLYGSVVRPVKELKGFKQITLKPYEEQLVEFEIGEEMLKFYTANMEFKSEPGEFRVYIGPNSSVEEGIEFTLET